MRLSFVVKLAALAAVLLASAAPAEAAPVRRTDPTSSSSELVRGSTLEPNYADIRSVAERLIDEMLTRGVLRSRYEQAAQNPFRICVKYVSNQTSSDRISTDQFLSIIEESLLQTGVVRLFEKDSDKWEYSLDVVLDNTEATDGRKRQKIYKLTLTLADNENEKIGIWSEELQLTKAR